MMDKALLEQQLSGLPLYIYEFIDPKQLDFADRIRYICEHDCPMYGSSWACPPAVGSVEECKARCLSYENCLLISTITEVADITDIHETLETRHPHEEITNQVRDLMQEMGVEPFVLSTESCAVCETCAYKQGFPCRRPERMHPCVESQGINIIPTLESAGIDFQYGANIVTWVSLLLF